jgi:hypothetical protein
MMEKRRYLTSLAVVLLAASAVQAQMPPRGGINPSQRPAFSPYLNLLRTDQDPSLNYFGLVRPQVDFRQSLGQVEQAEAGLADRQNQLNNSVNSQSLPATGHAAGFMTQSRYFMSKGASGAGGRQGAPVSSASMSRPLAASAPTGLQR